MVDSLRSAGKLDKLFDLAGGGIKQHDEVRYMKMTTQGGEGGELVDSLRSAGKLGKLFEVRYMMVTTRGGEGGELVDSLRSAGKLDKLFDLAGGGNKQHDEVRYMMMMTTLGGEGRGGENWWIHYVVLAS